MNVLGKKVIFPKNIRVQVYDTYTRRNTPTQARSEDWLSWIEFDLLNCWSFPLEKNKSAFSSYFSFFVFLFFLCLFFSLRPGVSLRLCSSHLLLSASTYFIVRVLSACVICTLPHLGVLLIFLFERSEFLIATCKKKKTDSLSGSVLTFG